MSFAERWHQKECELGLDFIASGIVNFRGCDLPVSAAPCLGFDAAYKPQKLLSLVIDPKDISESDKCNLESFTVFGSDGAGNPICIDEVSGIIYLYDHERGFREKQLMNTTLTQLAECMLAYMGENDRVRLENAIKQIDAAALSVGSFWSNELSQLT